MLPAEESIKEATAIAQLNNKVGLEHKVRHSKTKILSNVRDREDKKNCKKKK